MIYSQFKFLTLHLTFNLLLFSLAHLSRKQMSQHQYSSSVAAKLGTNKIANSGYHCNGGEGIKLAGVM